MDADKAHTTIKALADGMDPASGLPLADDQVTQRPDVIRALFQAATLLEREARRERRLKLARLSLPRNTGKEWSHEEDRTLLSRFRAGTTIADIAFIHGRTERAIAARLEKLGVQPAAAAQTAPRPLSS